MTKYDPARGCGCMAMLASAATTLLVIIGLVCLVWSRWPK